MYTSLSIILQTVVLFPNVQSCSILYVSTVTVETYKIEHDWEMKCFVSQSIFYKVSAVTENFKPSVGGKANRNSASYGHYLQTGKTAMIRRTGVRETCIS